MSIRASDDSLDRSHITILLVEEDSWVRRTAQRGLAKRGYHVISAGDGGRAWSLLTAHRGRIDVVISNLPIPRIDPATVHLFTSARLGDAERLARSETRTGFLAKPWSIAELEASILRLLGPAPDV